MSKATRFGAKSARHLRMLLVMSMFSALSIVFGKLLAFNIGDTVRISFENLPILFAGIFLDPLHGMIVGVVADLLGCFIVGYTINPIITASAALIGFCAGLFFRCTKPLPQAARIFIAAFAAHLLGSILLKTIGLIVFYGSPSVLFLVRTYYLAIAGIEAALITTLAKTPVPHALDKLLDRPSEEKGSIKK